MNYVDIDCREESETEEEIGESEEESSNEDSSEDKMYINEKKIRIRNPPKSLANIMSKLKNAQIKSLKDMGFGSFVGYKINRFLTALARWLLLYYDPMTSVLQAGDVKIKITSQTVHDIFGLPMRLNQTFLTCLKKGTDIKKLDWRGYLLKCLKRNKRLWNGGLFNGPSTFLTVLYAQKCMPMVLKRSSTAVITKWTARKLVMLQKEMIASNENIIAHDTDIETHETNAAKTTPRKERMTKSKIIAAKNAVLMNGIACDLEKAIQQHPGDKEFESIKLQWNEKVLKRASEMKKDKERPCEQIFKVDRGMEVEGEKHNQEMEVDLEKTDAHKTIDADKQGASSLKDMDFQNKNHVKVVSTVEESSSVLPANDIPSFDLGLTPTPPDVNVNADKEDVSNQDPMLENIPLTFTRISAKLRLSPKKAKEQESTTTASTTTASTIVKFLELVEVISTTVKEPSSDLLPNDAPSFDLGLTPTPPDVNLDTEPKLENERVKKNAKEQGPTITTSPIDALALVTPTIERKRKDLPKLEYEHVKKNTKEMGSTNTRTTFDVMPLSFAMPNTTLSEKTLNEKDNVKSLTYFIDDIELVMKSAKVENISKIDMVLFPVLLAKSHYYLFVFNLKTPKIEILDNSKNGINVALDERYGESFTKLTYIGYAKNWKCGFKNEGWEQQIQIYDLRKKYLSKILKSDLNRKRIYVLNELNQFRKLPNEEKLKYLKDRFARIQNRVKNWS
nr:hypothetical protein [Tanacetum cinerariifolium]